MTYTGKPVEGRTIDGIQMRPWTRPKTGLLDRRYPEEGL